MRLFLSAMLALVLPFSASASAGSGRVLTYDERVAATRAVERVYWAHRIWPDQNPDPKPSFEAAMPDDVLRREVDETLRKSAALDTIWHRPITHAQLQAEMDRIGRETKDGAMLHEVLAALGDDATLEAEVLARPILADRLLRSWYAFDPRFHGEVHGRAEQAVRSASGTAGLRGVADRYAEITWTTRAGSPPRNAGQPVRETVQVAPDELARMRDWIAGVAGTLQESEDAFYVSSVLADTPDTLTIATSSWPKVPFGAWWGSRGPSQTMDAPADASGYAPIQTQNVASYCVNDTWTSTSQAVPSPRVSPETVWTGTEMIVWSGSMPTPDTTSGARYNPVTDSWTPMTLTNAPQLRYGVDAVWTGTQMIVWGGGGTTTNTGGRYNPTTDTWLATSTIGAPSPRQSHSSVWSGTELIVWGGYDATTIPTTYFDTGGRYNPATDTWVATSTAGPPTARGYHRAVWVANAGVMVVWGGNDGASSFQTGSRYSPATNSWNPTTLIGAPSARAYFTAVTTGSQMLVWGGVNSGAELNDGGVYDPVTGGWSAITTTGAPVGRHNHTAVWTGSRMIVWGGWAYTGTTVFASGGRYDPVANAWTATTLAGAPAARRYHAAVWTGTEMIVWGGDDGAFHDKNTGGRYDPSTDSWVPTGTVATSGNPPTARWGFSTVWTGTQMLVWGGINGLGLWSDGAGFDPATASWGYFDSGQWGVSYAYHSAVWTGTRMLVFGGYDGEYWNSLWYFEPSTGTWDSLGIAPIAPREKQTAVWTGTGMIVWGGEDGGTAYNDGAIYTPGTGTWQVLAATTLLGRYEHTAIWTGSQMWVWGGHDLGTTVFGDGARYTPSTDTWTSFPTKGAPPSARYQHTAVWTGSQMIVWGGTDGTTYLDTGSEYPNAGGGWTVSPTTGAPRGRTQHTAVWDGGEMIVWGGRTATTTLYSDGARLILGGETGGTWSARLSPLEEPTARYEHTAVWNGNGRMIVWGGHGQDTQIGGVYCACASSLAGLEGAAGLVFAADKATFSWGPANGAALFNVYRGFETGAWSWNHSCFASSLATTSATDGIVPAPGSFYYYLVSGRNGCGESTLGTDSTGAPRPNANPCP